MSPSSSASASAGNYPPQAALREIINNLRSELRVDRHFVIRYTRHNQWGEAGSGGRAVLFEDTPALYRREITWTLRYLRKIGLCLPAVDSPRGVYLLDLSFGAHEN